MSESRYERINQVNGDNDNENVESNLDINSNDNNGRGDTTIEMPNQNMLNGFLHTAMSTLGLILVYFILSIGLTFYQGKFLKVIFCFVFVDKVKFGGQSNFIKAALSICFSYVASSA